jgi:hypothetical protein
MDIEKFINIWEEKKDHERYLKLYNDRVRKDVLKVVLFVPAVLFSFGTIVMYMSSSLSAVIPKLLFLIFGSSLILTSLILIEIKTVLRSNAYLYDVLFQKAEITWKDELQMLIKNRND